jgi:acetyl esterase/lipase
MNSPRRLEVAGRDPLEVLTRPARKPDLVVHYGDGADQVADVHLPRRWSGREAGSGGWPPLIIFLHGGFWRPEYGREHTAPLAEALAEDGFAVCAPEYRRTGQAGGGWPGTFDDVATAVDRLPGILVEATGGQVDMRRVVVAGHSAGGHLALWAAGRHLLPVGSRWRSERPVGKGVVALAAVADLATCYRRGLGQGAAGALMEGGPDQYPDRYAMADPLRLLPAGVPVRLVHGTCDDRVPSEMSMTYALYARAAGAIGAATATVVLLPGTGHFELIDPLSEEWPQVADAFWHVAGLTIAV